MEEGPMGLGARETPVDQLKRCFGGGGGKSHRFVALSPKEYRGGLWIGYESPSYGRVGE